MGTHSIASMSFAASAHLCGEETVPGAGGKIVAKMLNAGIRTHAHMGMSRRGVGCFGGGTPAQGGQQPRLGTSTCLVADEPILDSRRIFP